MDDYGFTNDKSKLDEVIQFRIAAVADGWTISPGCGEDSVERAAELERDGFKLMVITRTDKYQYQAEVVGWGPDGLGISVSIPYDWKQIQDAVHFCKNCKTHGVETQRYSFAGRCCAKCLPDMRKRHEYPGWTN